MQSKVFVLGVASEQVLLGAVRQLPFVEVSSDGSMRVLERIDLRFIGPRPPMLALLGTFDTHEIAAVRSLACLEDEQARDAVLAWSQKLDGVLAAGGSKTRVEILRRDHDQSTASRPEETHEVDTRPDDYRATTKAKEFRCDRCYRLLRRLDMSSVRVFGNIGHPVIYEGVECPGCGKTECAPCKGDAPTPCSWCGHQVAPAIEPDPNSSSTWDFVGNVPDAGTRTAELVLSEALDGPEPPSFFRRLTGFFKKGRDRRSSFRR